MASAPGRANLIGEHVDYCGGRVLPFAIPNRTMVAVGPSPDGQHRFFSSRIGSEVVFARDAMESGGDWADLLRGVILEYRDLGVEVPVLAGWVDTDVPLGGGLSSSAALAVAFATAIEVATNHPLPPQERAELCQRAEHRAVGVACGLMDPMAAACCEPGRALLFDTRTGEASQVPLTLPDMRLVLVDSRVPRELKNSAYNDRRAECEGALASLRDAGWELADLRDVDGSRLSEAEALLDEAAFRRVRHQVSENERVLASVEALAAGDAAAFGALLDGSHASLRDDFDVSHSDVDELVTRAREFPGVLGARMTGAGFGGFVLLLVVADEVRAIADHLVETYYSPRERAPVILDAGMGSAAARIDFPALRSTPPTPTTPPAEA